MLEALCNCIYVAKNNMLHGIKFDRESFNPITCSYHHAHHGDMQSWFSDMTIFHSDLFRTVLNTKSSFLPPSYMGYYPSVVCQNITSKAYDPEYIWYCTCLPCRSMAHTSLIHQSISAHEHMPIISL